MDLVRYNITDAITSIMRPVLASLQKLTVREVRFGPLLLSMLPLWAPELRVLKYIRMCGQGPTDELIRFDNLQQSYPKLTMLTFFNVDYVRNKNIDGFLMRNPNLKQIELVVYRNIDDHILQSIAKHVHKSRPYVSISVVPQTIATSTTSAIFNISLKSVRGPVAVALSNYNNDNSMIFCRLLRNLR